MGVQSRTTRRAKKANIPTGATTSANATVEQAAPVPRTSTPSSIKSARFRLSHIALLISFFAFRQWLNVLVHSPVISCPDTQPLVLTFPDVLPKSDFNRLRNAVMSTISFDEGAVKETNQLDGNNFGNTRGYVLSFNRDGLEELKNSKYNVDDALMSYFRLASLPSANAFVLNVLVCEDQHSNSNYDTNTTAQDMAVRLHVDNTIAIDSMYEFYAHQVSVLYLQVPDDMQGGELELYFRNSTGAPTENVSKSDVMLPDELITPAEGLLVGFRGDAFHQVRAVASRLKTPRVSLVLENYYVPTSQYNNTVRWLEDRNGFRNRTFDFIAWGNLVMTYLSWVGITVLVILAVQDRFLSK